MTNDGIFVALEGIDGCGKTSLARAAADRDLGDRQDSATDQVVFVSRRSVSTVDEFSRHLMTQNANMLWNSGDATTLSPAFWVTLQASWFTALSDTVIRPLLAEGATVVVDGWFYKFWSKLLNQGYSVAELEVIFGGAARPDHVIVVDPDVGEVFDRGRDFRPSEMGMHAGFGNLNRQTFIEYQAAGRERLLEFAQRWTWTVLPVDHGEPLARTAERVKQIVADELAKTGRWQQEFSA